VGLGDAGERRVAVAARDEQRAVARAGEPAQKMLKPVSTVAGVWVPVAGS
jgi:hypothetical protein